MAKIAFNPLVPVFSRYARGYPLHPEGEPAFYGPFSEACTTPFEFDAHVAAYSCPEIPRRLAGSVWTACKPVMSLWIVDVDGPNHKADDVWWASERTKVRALFDAHGWSYCYRTTGGYRIVYGLRDEFVIDSEIAAKRWRASYQDWLGILKRDFGIEGDPACADFARCFRLPRVRRDDVDVVPLDEVGEPDRMLRWREPYCAVDDPRCVRPEPVEVKVPVPAPVSEDKLAEAATVLASVWPRRGRHIASLALCGALAKAGWTEEAIAEFVMAVSEFSEAGNGNYEKRLSQARSSVERVARGEEVAGWLTLEQHLITDADAKQITKIKDGLVTAQRAIGQPPASDAFALAIANAKPKTTREQIALAAAELRPGMESDRFTYWLDQAATLLLPAIEQQKKVVAPQPYGETMRSLNARSIKDQEWLIRELVPAHAVGAIAAEPKVSKTWLAIDQAVSVASGTVCLGKYAVDRPAGVFFFFAEDHEGSVRRRVNAIAKGKNLPADGDWQDRLITQAAGRRLDVMSDIDLCVLAASVWFAAECTGVKIELLILDPLSDIHSGDEDTREGMQPVMTRLRALRHVLDCTVEFVHHSKKLAEGKVSRGGQRMRGSSAIHGAIDFGIYMDMPRGDRGGEFISRVESETRTGRSAGVFDLKLLIEDDQNRHAVNAVFTWMSVSDALAKLEPESVAQQRAVDIVLRLGDQGAPLTTRQLQAKIGGGAHQLTAALKIAEDEGWIAANYHGKVHAGYMITESGRVLWKNAGGRAFSNGHHKDEPMGTEPPTPSFLSQLL